jgi:5,10-methylenetetrahydromethanopterin reductase
MEFGIVLPPAADAWRIVQRAEELGFTQAWFYDTQLLCADVFVAMTGAALKTSRIKLGAGVLIPSNRLAPVTANALASLNKLAPGRIVCGLGTGNTGRRTMGLKAQKLSELAEYTRIIRGMLRGETVEATFEGKQRKIRFMNPERGMINIEDPIPIHFSAFGPKARALTAELADGFINAYMSPATLEQCAEIRAAWQLQGRDPATCYASCLVMGCVLAPGEPYDSPRAMAQAGPFPAIALHGWAEDGEQAAVPPPLKPLVDAYRNELYLNYLPADARYLKLHEGHLMFVREDERRFIGGELIRHLTLTGTADEIKPRVAALAAAGYDQLMVQLVPGPEHALDDWAGVFGLRGA